MCPRRLRTAVEVGFMVAVLILIGHKMTIVETDSLDTLQQMLISAN